MRSMFLFVTYGTRQHSRCYHDEMKTNLIKKYSRNILVIESPLNQLKSENSFLSRRTYPVELVKACVVLDMFKTFFRSEKSVVQLLKNEVLYYYNTVSCLRGRPFDSWGGGGGYGCFVKKRLFSKFWKINSLFSYLWEKNSLFMK